MLAYCLHLSIKKRVKFIYHRVLFWLFQSWIHRCLPWIWDKCSILWQPREVIKQIFILEGQQTAVHSLEFFEAMSVESSLQRCRSTCSKSKNPSICKPNLVCQVMAPIFTLRKQGVWTPTFSPIKKSGCCCSWVLLSSLKLFHL